MKYCDLIFGICQAPKDWLNVWLSFAAVVISFISLMIAIRFASKSFRPIVSVAVKAHAGGNASIIYNLDLLNSGVIPAKNIHIKVEKKDVDSALAIGEYNDMKAKWLACFDPECVIPVLQNGTKVSCSFGLTTADNTGFWNYGAIIPVVVEYQGWFGAKYTEPQVIYIRDSDSFTGYMWSKQA